MSSANDRSSRVGIVKTLEYPDQHHLNSAMGWLELGNHREAKVEAAKISLLGRTCQSSFLVRWRIASRAGLWPEAHRLAQEYTRTRPKLAVGWICLSYSLYRLGRPLEAWMQLLPRVAEFPTVSAIPYILACYASRLGNEKLTSRFLSKSAALGGPRTLRSRGLDSEEVDALAANKPQTHVPPTVLETTLDRLGFGSG